ncbi:MAG: acyltransferase [Candidatus Sericytochromatia bacterium]
MIKKFVEFCVQKLKKNNFTFDDNLKDKVILSLLYQNIFSLIRGYKIVFFLKKPNLLFLGKQVSFFNIHNISFGKLVKLGDFVYVSALGKNSIYFGNNVSIGAFSRIIISTTFNNLGEGIKIGNNVGIGEFAYLGGAGGLEIGDDTIVGQYLSTHPENHIFSDTETLIRKQGTTRQGIRIGSNCWIGSKVTILDGVNIGNNCIIAAGAVVTKNFDDNSVIGGVPAKLIKKTK